LECKLVAFQIIPIQFHLLFRDLKNVNTWFQNKRTAAKKRALSWKNPTSDMQRRIRSSSSTQTTSIPHALRQTASLDFIAKVSERPSRLPATPRRRSDFGTQTQIWERMLSSPPTGPISPSVDAARFKVLPTRSKTWKSLEWACVNARASGSRESDKENIPEILPRSALKKEQGKGGDCEDTDTEVDEALTPDSSTDWFPMFVRSGTQKMIGEEELISKDMEVAMVLLDFNRHCKEGIMEKN
jgi:hypothetical protein